MLSDTLRDALNEQINNELHAAYLYLSMSEWFASRNLDGFAHWMRMQREEEIGHAMKIYDFVLDRNARVELMTIQAPNADFASPADVARKALEHEQKVTRRINELLETAKSESDFPTEALLQWFVIEQVEEEASALKIAEQIEMAGDDKAALLMLDREMGARSAGMHE